MKYGIAVAVILGLSVSVSHQDQKTRDQYEQKCAQFNARAVAPASHSEDCDKGAENAARHLPRWYRVFGWPEGITTWAILLTLLALAEQTGQTRKAAEGAQRAADAAFAQIELMKSKERSRLSISPLPLTAFGKDEPQEIGFLVTNFGGTHATAVRIISNCEVNGFGGVPLDPQVVPRDGCILPDHLDGGKEGVSRIKVVRPDSPAKLTVPLFWFPSIENVGKIRNVYITVSGRVDYDDIFGAHYFFRFRYWFHLLEFDMSTLSPMSSKFPIVSVAKWSGYEDDEESEPS